MGLFRRSPSPAAPAPAGQQHPTSNEYISHLGVEHRQYRADHTSPMPSPSLSLDRTRSRSPMPASNHADAAISSASPWTGYLKEGQYASAEQNSKKPRSKAKKTEFKNVHSTPMLGQRDTPATNPVVELRKLDLGSGSSRASTADLARFSINGMLNLVDQRISLDEQQQNQIPKTTGLGLRVDSSADTSRARRTNQLRTMHTVGEEEETLFGSAHVTANASQSRHRTPSSSSEAASLRDEVVDLLAIAQKASSNMTRTSSSSSLSPSFRHFNSDMIRSTSSASARTCDSLSPPNSATPGNSSKPRFNALGTASKEELEELARAVSPALTVHPAGKTKKKFGFFGGGKKGDITAKGRPILPAAWQAQETGGLPHRPQPSRPAGDIGPMERSIPQSISAEGSRVQTSAHRVPPVAGSHRAQVTAQHRRKRSMSVGDASAFLPIHLDSNKDMCKPRPAVYDESYFSNLKQPYCATSLGRGSQQRAKQMVRLGIEQDVDRQPTIEQQEGESLASAKERLLAQARTAVGHPGGKDQKRQGQVVVQDNTSNLRLNPPTRPAQTTWTSPVQAIETRTTRSNSDASILDPFLPSSKPAMSNRQMHLAVPAATSVNGRFSSDSLAAIGPPPASPLPSPPRTSSALPTAQKNGTSSSTVPRAASPSPSQQMHLQPARMPPPSSPLPPPPPADKPPASLQATGTDSPPATRSRSPSAVPSESSERTEYDFDLRPHRTKQQGRPRLSPLQEGIVAPLDSPSLDKMAVPPRSFGTRGIVQRPPSALDMTLLPSPSSTSSASTASLPSAKSLAASTSSTSIPTPKARDFNQAQIRRRQETESTLASHYSTEGEFEGYDPSRSSSSSAVSSSIARDSMHADGVSSHASHTTLSSATSYNSYSSMTSYNSSSSCLSRPSLSMDGHSTEDESSVSSHIGGGFVHVNKAVPMKPPRRGMVASPSSESINNLAGIGLAKGQYSDSRRTHFGWSRHRAMHDLASHAEDLEYGLKHDEHAIRVVEQDMAEGSLSEGISSPGSEDDAYAGILGEYQVARHDSDEGYIGSSPELVSSSTALSPSKDAPSRLKMVNSRHPVETTRSYR